MSSSPIGIRASTCRRAGGLPPGLGPRCRSFCGSGWFSPRARGCGGPTSSPRRPATRGCSDGDAMTAPHEASRSGGFALLVVLWSLGLLALLGVLLTSTARVEMGVAVAARDHAAAEAAADGAIRQAVFMLLGGGQVGSA